MAEIHIKNVDPQRKAMYAKQCSKRGVKLGELVQKLLNKHFWDHGPKKKQQEELERLYKIYHQGVKHGGEKVYMSLFIFDEWLEKEGLK